MCMASYENVYVYQQQVMGHGEEKGSPYVPILVCIVLL
jgi:hypothetical protein